MNILNLTQHAATPEQVAAGVIEPYVKEEIARLLTFETLPTKEEIEDRAWQLARAAHSNAVETAMIGGAPFFMAPLERALLKVGIKPIYAFSRRESVEEPLPGGGVKKTQIFKHAGFVET